MSRIVEELVEEIDISELLSAMSGKDEVESFGLEQGIIHLMDNIDTDLTKKIINQLIYADGHLEPGEPIILFISSPGGDLEGTLAIINTMRSIGRPVITYNIGEIASGAAMIFASGTYRVCSPYSPAMFHQFSTFVCGKFGQLQASQKGMEIYHKIMCDFISSCISSKRKSTQSVDEIVSYLLKDTDTFLSPQEMYELGLCEEVGWLSLEFEQVEEEGNEG